jgi:hypothetical protein
MRDIIRPITETVGPVCLLREIAEDMGVDAIVRAIGAGVEVYDAGGALLADRSAIRLLNEVKAPGTCASIVEGV